jgi:SAM-dependent methyltransferase
MPKTDVFERHVERYEAWFERHHFAYQSELEAIRVLVPEGGRGIEIGVGTGRFAVPLGIGVGIEPAHAMGLVARRRGVDVVRGVAEALPVADASFDFALMVTTICFVDDADRSLDEARRVVRAGGALLVGFVDGASPLGRAYKQRRTTSVFYREAEFVSSQQLINALERCGFRDVTCRQTIFSDPVRMREPAPVLEGVGRGSFVVVRAVTPASRPGPGLTL